jgi:hypothetical protein
MRFKLRHENPFGPLFSPCCTVFILTFDFVPSFNKTGAQCQFADIPVIVVILFLEGRYIANQRPLMMG